MPLKMMMMNEELVKEWVVKGSFINGKCCKKYLGF